MDIAIMNLLLWGLLGILITALTLLPLAFWCWMFIDCLTKEPSEGNDKLIWCCVIFFGSILGAILYYFIRRPERIEKYGE